MANNKSAKKRIKINERNRVRNRFYKLAKILNSIYSLIDKGTKKNVFHKNTAARKKAQLAIYLKQI